MPALRLEGDGPGLRAMLCVHRATGPWALDECRGSVRGVSALYGGRSCRCTTRKRCVCNKRGATMNAATLQLWRTALHAAIDVLFDTLERGVARKPMPPGMSTKG
jgi:hypothetical protein